MKAKISNLVEIVHDSGRSDGYANTKDSPYTPGERFEDLGDDRVRKVETFRNGHVRVTFLARHYADLTGVIMDLDHEKYNQDIPIRLHLKKLYSYHFSQKRRNVTKRWKDQFDADIERLVIKSPKIYVNDRGKYFEPEYWDFQSQCHTIMTI